MLIPLQFHFGWIYCTFNVSQVDTLGITTYYIAHFYPLMYGFSRIEYVVVTWAFTFYLICPPSSLGPYVHVRQSTHACVKTWFVCGRIKRENQYCYISHKTLRVLYSNYSTVILVIVCNGCSKQPPLSTYVASCHALYGFILLKYLTTTFIHLRPFNSCRAIILTA